MSTSRNTPKTKRRRRNSIRPGRMNSRKSGMKYAPGLSLIGEADNGSDVSSMNTTGTSSKDKDTEPLHLTLKKAAAQRRLGDDLQRLQSITGAVRTTKRSVFWKGDMSSSDEEDDEDFIARKIDPPPGISLIRHSVVS